MGNDHHYNENAKGHRFNSWNEHNNVNCEVTVIRSVGMLFASTGEKKKIILLIRIFALFYKIYCKIYKITLKV